RDSFARDRRRAWCTRSSSSTRVTRGVTLGKADWCASLVAQVKSSDLLPSMVEVVLVELEGVVFETRGLRLESLRDALASRDVPAAVLGLPTRAAVVAALNAAGVRQDDVAIDLIVLAAEQAFASRLATGGVNVTRGARAFLERAVSAARVGAVTRLNRADATA